MDFENVYRSRFIIYKLLKLRGYDTSKYDNQSKEELNILFQHHSKKINTELDSLDMFIEGKNNNILVKYLLSEKIRSKLIEKQIENQYSNLLTDEDTCILITKENLKESDKLKFKGGLDEFLNRNFMTKGRFIQIFWLNTLLFDPTTHILNPKYKILNDEEKKGILHKYNIEENLLPSILINDPLGMFYGVKLNEVIEIIKPSETNGFTKSYRLCIN